MGKKGRILGIALLVIALSVMIWTLLRPREPEPMYEGKTLSAWLDVSRTNYLDYDKVCRAIRAIGTNALPTALRMLRAHDPPFKLKLIALLKKQHFVAINYVNSTTRCLVAEEVFVQLGPAAASAVPDLIKIYQQYQEPWRQQEITRIFGYIGPPAEPAVPLLMQLASSTNDPSRNNALFALIGIRQKPEFVVPMLISMLGDTNEGTRVNALVGLGNFGSSAKAAVPALTKLIREKDKPESKWLTWWTGNHNENFAVEALKRIDPVAATNLMEDLHEKW